jgi:hypothetical protein
LSQNALKVVRQDLGAIGKAVEMIVEQLDGTDVDIAPYLTGISHHERQGVTGCWTAVASKTSRSMLEDGSSSRLFNAWPCFTCCDWFCGHSRAPK